MIAAAAFVALMLQADRPASALERALAERACDLITMSGRTPASDRDKCVDDQLAALRDDLGANFSRVSVGDRQKLDAACSALAGAETREAYLDCVSRQLAPLRERLRKSKPAAADTAAPAADTAAAPIAPPPPMAPTASRSRLVLIAGGAFVLLAAAAGLVVAKRKRQPASHPCRSCGTPVESAGALCATCRHEAAETLRRAAAARAAEADEAARREKEAAEAAAEQELQREAARQAALEAEARQREADEAARQREQEALAARQTTDAAAPPDADEAAALDPHTVLGVARDASADAIRAAYDEAMAKYDPELVSHLSPEVQHHYREKREAAERAFQMLTTPQP